MKPIFAIFKLNYDDSYSFMGNGFFIDDNGTFVSAGHVFKDKGERYFIGFPGDEDFLLYEVSVYTIKYRKPYTFDDKFRKRRRNYKTYQKSPEYKDIAVGKTSLVNTPFLRFRKERPDENDTLHASYYKSSETCPRRLD